MIPHSCEKARAIHETRQLLRWAAQALTATEKAALTGLALERTQRETASGLPVTRGAVFMAQQSGLAKMRRRLHAVGIRRAEDLLL